MPPDSVGPPRRQGSCGHFAHIRSLCVRRASKRPPPPSRGQGFFRIIKNQGGGDPSPKTPSPLPQTKVTIVGKNEIYNRENLVRPFLVHQVLGPKPPPPLPPCSKEALPVACPLSPFAQVTQHLFTPAQMLSWGWRIPFLLAALPGMVSICVAHTVHESAEFEEKHTDSSESLFSCMQEGLRGVEGHWRAGLLGICGTMAASCYLYVTAVYWREWLVDVGDQTPDTALSVLILGQLFTVVAQVPVAVSLHTVLMPPICPSP